MELKEEGGGGTSASLHVVPFATQNHVLSMPSPHEDAIEELLSLLYS